MSERAGEVRGRAAGAGPAGLRAGPDGAAVLRDQPVVRIAPGRKGVSIWSAALFADSDSVAIREFLVRVFSVDEVAAVEIDRRKSFGRLRFFPSVDAGAIWRKLGQALRPAPAPKIRAGLDPLGLSALYLDGPEKAPIRIYRVGAALTSWRAVARSEGRVRLTHPRLFNRRDVAYRLEEELSAILGVEDFSTRIITGSVSIRFDPQRIDVERLVRRLERAWPRVISGPDEPPSNGRLLAAGGLVGLAYTGQYLVPALRPLAVLGVTIYGAPNVANAARQATHLQIGLPALYSMGLAFTLLSGMPFASTIMATLMQFWPRLAFLTMKRRQRQLFAVHRRQATSARLLHEGVEIETDVENLAAGDLIAVHQGETMPVDGVVVAGLAAVDEETLSGEIGAIDKTAGDPVYAASFNRGGRLTVRVERVGGATAAGHIGARLPHARIDGLPSSAEVERIANRNAKPALAIAAVNFLATRVARPSQAVIRPDYATAPRFGAQLGALHGIADGLSRGLFFRNPAALDRLAATDIYVFDDGCDLERRNIAVAEVIRIPGVSEEAVLGFAAAAYPATHSERTYALLSESVRRDAPIPAISQRTRHAGAVRYIDADHHIVEIAAPAYLDEAGVVVPPELANASRSRATDQETEPLLRPLWVLINGAPIGAVTFTRSGDLEAKEVVAALKARNARARFVHISRRPQAEAASRARRIGVASVFGGLDAHGKARILKRLGRRTMWIGDGASAEAPALIEVSGVSISVAGLAHAPDDKADILALQPGLVSLVPLRRVGQAHLSRINADYRAVYAANLFGAAGGFVAGFGGFEAGVASNIGTAAVYLSHWKRLHDLGLRMETRRAALASAIDDESFGPPVTIEDDRNDKEGYAPYPEHRGSLPTPAGEAAV